MLIPATDPTAQPKVMEPRRDGVQYNVDHWDGRFVVRTNADGAVVHRLERSHGVAVLDLGLRAAALGQVAEIDSHYRPAALLEVLDEVVAPFEAAELGPGATARLHVAVRLAGENQHHVGCLVGRPIAEELRAFGGRSTAIGGSVAGRLQAVDDGGDQPTP